MTVSIRYNTDGKTHEFENVADWCIPGGAFLLMQFADGSATGIASNVIEEFLVNP